MTVAMFDMPNQIYILYIEAVEMFDSIGFPPVVTACHNYSETESITYCLKQNIIIILCALSL